MINGATAWLGYQNSISQKRGLAAKQTINFPVPGSVWGNVQETDQQLSRRAIMPPQPTPKPDVYPIVWPFSIVAKLPRSLAQKQSFDWPIIPLAWLVGLFRRCTLQPQNSGTNKRQSSFLQWIWEIEVVSQKWKLTMGIYRTNENVFNVFWVDVSVGFSSRADNWSECVASLLSFIFASCILESDFTTLPWDGVMSKNSHGITTSFTTLIESDVQKDVWFITVV